MRILEQFDAEGGQVGSQRIRTVHLQHMKPSESVPILMIYANLPRSIVPIEGLQILLLRDYSSNIRQQLKFLEEVEQKESIK